MATPLNCLLVEDSASDAELIIRELRRAGFDPQWQLVETEAAFLHALQSPLQLVISDYAMPKFDGLRAVQLLREHHPDTPFILVSGTVGEEAAVEAMRHGATDYLIKDRISRLGSAVTRALEQQRLREERRQLEQQLTLQATALEAAANGFAITDQSGKILWVNPALVACTGYSSKELIGQSFRLLKSGQHAPLFYQELWTKLRAGQTWQGEFVNRRKDGSLYFDQHTITPVCSADGKITHYVAVMQDVTARKHAEAVKAELAHRNESFVRALGEIVYDHDITAHRIEWAGDSVKCVGWAIAELGQTTQAWSDRVHPDDLPRVRAQLETLSIEPLFASEYRFQHKAGHFVWIFDRGVISRDAQGRITRVIGIMWDISERKRAEEVLRENEARFRQLAENIQEVFWMTDLAKNQVIYISPGYEKIWGRAPEELYRSPQLWLEAIHPGDRERIKTASLAKQAAGTYDETYRIQRPDGCVRWVRDRAFPVRDADKQVYRIVGIAEDITRQRELEEQFRQVQKMEAVGQLAGGVAHDFNNLLTVIRGGSELLLTSEEPGSVESKELLQQIVAASDRAANLTRQLLVFSRKQELQSQTINLNELIEDLTKMLRRIIGEDIRLHCELGTGLPAVQADPGMLEQVVMNLVVNARDAMPKGGDLTVRTTVKIHHGLFEESFEPAGTDTYVCLSVTDSGTGIPADILPHIFEPFFTTKDATKGTGLGLATVYGIVQQHHGWVTVESELGKGATFHVGLPASKTTVADKCAEPQERKLPRGTETILLVEDESSVRVLVRNVFERHGYRVLEADSGHAALAVWREHGSRIDMMLTDMVMPDGMTGLMLAEQLRQECPRLKIIFSSGYSPEAVTTGYALLPDSRFLQKPYNPQNLLRAVRDCLDAKPPAHDSIARGQPA